MRLGKYVTPLPWTILVLDFATGSGLVCWECESVKNPDCGHYFRSGVFDPVPCKAEETSCALQRQDTPGEVFAIRRGCYMEGQIPGLNSTNGCRNWTIETRQGAYTALYCFCDTSLCNSAQTSVEHRVLLTVVYSFIISQGFRLLWYLS